MNREFQGQGLGQQLVLAAGRRALFAARQGGGSIRVIDAKNIAVADWYDTLGANRLLERSLMLVMRLELIAEVLGLPYPPSVASTHSTENDPTTEC